MRASLLLALASPTVAHAGWPEDVVVSGMLEHDGQLIDAGVARARFDELVAELGAGIANKPLAPARTLGSAGFDLSIGGTFVLTRTAAADDGSPSGWTLAHGDEDPGAVLFIPTLTARKGLPSSFEVGASAGWVGGARQGVLSGFARLAPVEGYEPWPDIALQVGYSGYIGNPELDLGTIDLTATLGGTFAFGSDPEIKQAQVSPYIGGGLLLVYARVDVDPEVQEALFPADGDAEPGRSTLAPIPQVQGGIQVTNSTVLFRLAGTWSPGAAPSIHTGMGFMF